MKSYNAVYLSDRRICERPTQAKIRRCISQRKQCALHLHPEAQGLNLITSIFKKVFEHWNKQFWCLMAVIFIDNSQIKFLGIIVSIMHIFNSRAPIFVQDIHFSVFTNRNSSFVLFYWRLIGHRLFLSN